CPIMLFQMQFTTFITDVSYVKWGDRLYSMLQQVHQFSYMTSLVGGAPSHSLWGAPAPSMRFQLGSIIPFRATVESQSHRPLKIYMERCVAATDANISRAAQVHPIIANIGCLIESKSANSSFLPRRRPAEIRLYLQAFKFALGQNIFLHCDLEAWDVQCVDRKACHYMQQQWELLDDPSQSNLCSCCEFTCYRRMESTNGMPSNVLPSGVSDL
uniref:ZP domain-containing protein n=1 Tax=Cyprinus carpio TaxID=7962 RepID=A0A8C2CL31_CYPCA